MRQLRRAAALLLSVLLIVGVMPAARAMASDMVDFEAFDDGSAFSQKFVEVKKISVGKTGQQMSISFDIINPTTSTDMTNIKIRLATEKEFKELFDIDDDTQDNDNDSSYRRDFQYPFEFTSDIAKVKSDIGTIKVGKKKSVTMNYKVKRNLKEGYYPAVFYLSYGDHNRDIPFGVNIWVTQSDATTESSENKLDYEFVVGENQSTPYASYNEVMNFNVNLRNSGLKKVYDVKVSMQLDADTSKFPFEINDGNYDRSMGDMEPDQTVSVPYSMAVREDVKTGFYPISFKISYREDSTGDFSAPVDKVFFVRVKGKDDGELSPDANINERTKARLIVDSFTTDPAEIYAGNPFVLKVRMKNASSNVKASNIMLTFVSEEVNNSPVFTADAGSTSMVINELAAGASSDLQMVFHPAPTAEQKSYTITIKEKYDSPEFKNAEEEVKIAVPVKQKPRLNTGTIEVMPGSIGVGSETNVMFGINNTGKVQLYNVMVRFAGDSIQESSTYVGNIKPGETGNVDTMITGTAPTMDDGQIKIAITFEDENGNVTEVDKEMTLTVTEESQLPPGAAEAGGTAGGVNGTGGMDDTPQPGFFSGYKAPLLVAGAVAAAAAAAAILLLRKRKKKRLEEEEMDDEIS